MDIKTTEDLIIARLISQITDLKIEGFPDDPEDYRLNHPIGAILVQYQGTKYSSPEEYNVIIQGSCITTFAISLFTKNLRTNSGAYGYLENIKTALTGLIIPGQSRLYPTEDGFLGLKDGAFHYGITFALRTTHEEP